MTAADSAVFPSQCQYGDKSEILLIIRVNARAIVFGSELDE
jgi:hypothetical protein